MIFKNLRLKNFKSHVNTSVDFNRGITLIVGSNGAGKSSIFEAITFALFKQSTVNNSDLVRTTKAKEGKIEMSVELTFTSFSEDYKILRTVKKNVATGKSSSSAMLYKVTDTRDEVIASGVREVDREIEQILSMDSNTFLNAIHVRQGEISDLIDKTPAERKELIGRLLKLEDLENAYKRLPGIMKEKTSKKDTLNGRIKNPEELEGELSQLNENRKKITQQIEVFSKQLEDIKLLEEEKSREKNRLDQLKIDYNNLNISFAHERENLVKLNSQKEELNGKMSQILEDEKQMAALKPEAERLETVKEFKENHIELTSLKKDENTKNEILTNISDNKKILEREKENHDKYLILKDEITQLKLTQTELSSEIKHAKSLEDKQKTITADIDRFSKKTDRFEDLTRDILKDFDTEIDSLKTDDELAELEKTVDELIAKKEDEISKIDAEITELRDEKARLAQQSESLKEPLEDIRKVENRCPTCQSEISEETKNDLINGYESTINNNSVRISEIEQSLDSLNDEKKYKNAELKRLSSIKNNTNEHALIISQVGKLTEELAQISEQLKNAQNMKMKLEETEESLGKKTEEFKLLEPNYNEYVKAETLLKTQDEAQIIKDLETLQGQIKAIEENLTILIQKDSELSLDISNDELNAKISDLEAKNSEYLRLTGSVQDKQNQENKISQNTLEIEAKQKIIEEIQNQIQTCGYDEKLHDTIIKEVKKLQDDFNSLFAGIEVNKNQLKNIDEQIKTIEDEIKLNNKYLEEYAALCDYLDLLEDFRYFYSKDGVQKDLRSQSRPLIQKYTRDFFEKFNFNYSDLILSDEYDIAIHGPEGEVKLDMVSGGEKIAIALSLRLAITQAMSKGSIETILLDEPTIHLDDYRKQELITVLRSMSVIPQMIIVTHDSELEAAADSIIKVNKVEGISKIGE